MSSDISLQIYDTAFDAAGHVLDIDFTDYFSCFFYIPEKYRLIRNE
jgi:hypothetical protein